MLRVVAFLIAALALTLPAWGQSSRRVALLIANSNYASASQLQNPANDIALVERAAHDAGFEVVLVEHDLNLVAFRRALQAFSALADRADVALVYYAGHGIELEGSNYLIPQDATLVGPESLSTEAISLEQVVQAVSGAPIRLVVLDACRANPFGTAWRANTRSVARGFAAYERDNVMILYSAAPGQLAADGDGRNSPFAVSFARALPRPGLPLQLLGGAVRDDVLAMTSGQQRPFVSASVTGTPIYLVPNAETTGATSPNQSLTIERATWQGAIAANSETAYRDYLNRYPAGNFSEQAQQALRRLGNSRARAQEPAQSAVAQFIGRWRRTRSPLGASCGRLLEVVSIGSDVTYFSYDSRRPGSPTIEHVTSVNDTSVQTQWQNGGVLFRLSGQLLTFNSCSYERDQ